MKVVCPNSNCENPDVDIDEKGIMENHYPSPKKTFTPERHCRLSGTVYTGEDIGGDPERPKPPERSTRYVGGLRGEYGM